MQLLLCMPSVARLIVAAGILGVLFGVARVTAGALMGAFPQAQPNRLLISTNAYGGSSSCQACHEEEYADWHDSHHKLAQRSRLSSLEAEAFTQNRSILKGSHSLRLMHSGEDYEVIAPGVTNVPEHLPITGVMGVWPLVQFLVSLPGNRLQALEAAYDPGSNEWFNVFGEENRLAGEWGHWTGRGMNWNSMCASCHNTRVLKGYQEGSDSYRTTMAEASVGCEACHGPMRQHADWERNAGRSDRKDPFLTKHTPKQIEDNCAFCHSRRGAITEDFKPGDALLDHVHLETVDASETFYADGQVRQEDYEYAAFLGSRMHWRGVQCRDCHNPHSAKTLLPGNWLCMRCHNGTYTNAPDIDPVGHSHHKVFGYSAAGVVTNLDLTRYQPDRIKETGGECVNCHMSQTVYMQRHRRHDHGFTTPDPLLTRQGRVPNACNRCHSDKAVDWALNWCNDWYGKKMDRPSRARALLIASAQRAEVSASKGLIGLLATNEQPYWRAVAAGLLGSWAAQPEIRKALCDGLNDPDALVRIGCVHSLEAKAQEPDVARELSGILRDPVRGARIAAAWALRGSLELSSPAGIELQEFLAVNADQPVGQIQLGAFELSRGQTVRAASYYKKAVEWDPTSPAVHHDYAIILAELNRAQEALQQIQEACRLEPTNAEFQYSQALAWNETGQTSNTVECLRTAVRLDPSFAKAWYNLGLVLDSLGRPEEALAAFGRAESADRADPLPWYAEACLLMKSGKADLARRALGQALKIEPGFEQARDLLRRLDSPPATRN